MKKLVILAAAALAAVACNKTYEVVPNTSEGPSIGFSTWTAQLTKVRTQGSSVFAANDNFAVAGFMANTGETPVVVFDDQEVKTENGTDWSYDPIRYWDRNYDSYTFFAVSPKGGATVDPLTGEVSADVSFGGDDKDILVANKKEVAKAAYGQAVNMVFNHAASLVDFKVKKSTDLTNATVSVTNFELSQISNAGTLTVSAYENDTDAKPIIVWNGTGTGTYGPGDGVTPVDYDDLVDVAEDAAFKPTEPGTPAASNFLINNLVVMPQVFGATGEAASQQLSITYRITTGTGTSQQVIEHTHTLYLADFDEIDDDAQDDAKIAEWEPGKHYTFFITLDANMITFTAEIIEWGEVVNGYHYLFNR